jgi:GNAT superfamily N-acetyltransferase
MVDVYSRLDGFPSPEEQPKYYEMLQNIGQITQIPDTRVLVALSEDAEILGGVVYFSDMKQYGSGGTAAKVKGASGTRLLAVSPDARKQGIGKALTFHCIHLAKQSDNDQVILHTTKSMQVAWKMYEKLGFERSEDLDFKQADLPVYGFRLHL